MLTLSVMQLTAILWVLGMTISIMIGYSYGYERARKVWYHRGRATGMALSKERITR